MMPRVILIILIIAAVSSVTLAAVFYNLKNKNNLNISTTPAGKSRSITIPDSTLPVPSTNKAVREARVVYTFSAILKEAKNTPTGVELTTISNRLPIFIVTKDTEVVFNENGKQTPASTSDFKTDQKLRITASYDLKQKAWTTEKVRIGIGQSAAGTSTSSAKTR